MLARSGLCAGTEIGNAIFTGATAICVAFTGIEGTEFGAGLLDDTWQHDPLEGATVTVASADSCATIMGQPSGQFMPEAYVSVCIQQAVSAVAGNATAANISTIATICEILPINVNRTTGNRIRRCLTAL